jgi:hypothetical protein
MKTNTIIAILLGLLLLGANSQNGLLLIEFDSPPTLGLLGEHNSQAYRTAEIERHLHSNERWFGLSGSASGEVTRMDNIGGTTTPFQMDAGNNTWGTWLQIVGSSDTPVDAGNVYFDLHRLEITAREENSTVHLVQMGCDTSGANALTNGNYSELMFVSESVAAQSVATPIMIKTRRYAAGTKCWMRVWAVTKDTGTVDFFIGLHEYEG